MNAMAICEYIVIRLAPDPIRNESVAIGVALFEPRSGGFTGVRLTPDLRRAQQLSPLFEPADLAGLEADLTLRLRVESPQWNSREYLLRLAQEGFSHSLQFTTPTAVLTPDPAAELDRLYQQFAAPPDSTARTVAVGTRRRILRHLERVFTEERLPRLLPAPARQWLGTSDAFRFDFHYRDRRDVTIHLIQALDIGGEESAIKELCFTVGRLRRLDQPFDVAGFYDAPPPSAAPPDVDVFVTAGSVPNVQNPADYHRDLLAEAGIRALPLDQAPTEAASIRLALQIS